MADHKKNRRPSSLRSGLIRLANKQTPRSPERKALLAMLADKTAYMSIGKFYQLDRRSSDQEQWFYPQSEQKNGSLRGLMVVWREGRRVPDKAKITPVDSSWARDWSAVKESDLDPKVLARFQARTASKQAAWKPPKLTKSLAKQVAKRLDKNWAQTGVDSLQDIRDALGSGLVAEMSMSDRIDNQNAVKKWKGGLSKPDLHKVFRWIEEVKSGKDKRTYRKTDEALNSLT